MVITQIKDMSFYAVTCSLVPWELFLFFFELAVIHKKHWENFSPLSCLSALQNRISSTPEDLLTTLLQKNTQKDKHLVKHNITAISLSYSRTNAICKCKLQPGHHLSPEFLSPLWLFFKDCGELRVHLEEPVLSASSRDVSGAAAGLRRAGWGALHWRQWEGLRELWLLGQEEEEKEEPRSGGPQARAPQLLAISTT